MTKEEKQLLLKDLCARLPYGVMVHLVYDENTTKIREMGLGSLHDIMVDNAEGKPYLRSMLSMTEEEKKDLKSSTCPFGTGYFNEKYLICPLNHLGEQISYEFMSGVLDWLNKKMFDYRGLIPMGLALEAPEDMYKTE